MDVYELIEQLGAEIVRNRAVVRENDERVVIAIVGENGLELTEAGKAKAEAAKPKAKASTPKTAKSAPKSTK